ncbi:methyltransferase domain-containing protein [Allochromatium palmeri]|uniref:Methyltransferase domain-containing protein n=2 Tax=Allochromatium palmeri TaxID=231048 RepID=A0A6N8E865_9GAMM|nr:methyltransferase domain-containing protein [Allochromatium palmeri]
MRRTATTLFLTRAVPYPSMKHTYYIRQSYLFCLYRNYMYDFQQYLAGRNVLEAGPNKGMLFEKYYPLTKKYTLLEPNEHFEKNYIKLQQRHPNLHYEIGTFETFEPAERFDTIVMMAVIAHIRSKPDEIFAKINDMLNPQGFLIIETNNTKRNLRVMALCEENYELVEAKTSYNGIIKWLKIDYRDVMVYRKP